MVTDKKKNVNKPTWIFFLKYTTKEMLHVYAIAQKGDKPDYLILKFVGLAWEVVIVNDI